MSPRNALNRMAASFGSPRFTHAVDEASTLAVDAASTVVAPIDELEAARARLSSIMAEVSATPVEDFYSYTRTQQQRNPATALRWFPALDLFVFVCAFWAAWASASVINSVFLDRMFPSPLEAGAWTSFGYFGLVSLGAIFWFGYRGHYRRRMPFWLEVQKLVNVLGFSMIVHGFIQFSAKEDFSRLWLMSGWVFAAFGLILARNVARTILRRKGLWQIRTLLVGSGLMADEARAALRSEPGLGYDIVAQVENLPVVLTHLDGSWRRLCDRFNADYVVIALDGTELAEADEAIASLVSSGLPFSVSPPLRHLPVLGMAAQYFFSHDVILMAPVDNLEQPIPRFVKRCMDVTVSGLALLALSPLFLVLAFLVKRDGGSAFFGDLRVGTQGKTFYCLKFRSMIMNSDAVLERYLKDHPEKVQEWETYRKLRDGDPRVTRVGAFMRRWSIDELPQLINVLRGDMSLVGPRPIMFTERGIYKAGLSQYSRVRPGLTGLWQVSGRSNVSFARRIQMESWYVRNWSLWHDIAILCKTVPVLLKKTGAY